MTDNSGTARTQELSARRTALLSDARRHFAQLADTNNPAALKVEIDKLLKKAGLDHAALDPSGRSPASAIRSSIESIVALQGIAEPGAPAPAPRRPAMMVTTARRLGRGLSVGMTPVVRVHHGIARIPVTRQIAFAAVFLNGIVFSALMAYALVASFENYRAAGSMSEAFYSHERDIAAPAVFTLIGFSLAMIQFARRRYLSVFRISAPVVFGIAGLAAFLVIADPDALGRILDSVEQGLTPSLPAPAHSQMWTGRQ